MLTTEEINRITCEILNDDEHEDQDSPEGADLRAKLRVEIPQLTEQGYEIKIPNE